MIGLLVLPDSVVKYIADNKQKDLAMELHSPKH
jgi:hypothetical protein